jgi:hypothetical protein
MNKMVQIVDQHHIDSPSANHVELYHYILYCFYFHYVHFTFLARYHLYVKQALMADSKFCFCTVYLDFAVMSNVLVREK